MKQRHGFTLIEIMIVVAIIGVLAAIAIPSFIQAIEAARRHACAANRHQIDGAKVRWALEQKQPADAMPTDTDLFGVGLYLEHKPDCPSRGVYALNAVEQKCTCSVSKHVAAQ